MIEITGNLWNYPATWRCITTNGTIKSNGSNVMGRGCAREAAIKFPKLPFELAQKISKYGNILHTFPEYSIITFPVKHNWYEQANLELIVQSSKQLEQLHSKSIVLLPRPGCGNGGLKWENVKPVIEFLPDTIFIISR